MSNVVDFRQACQILGVDPSVSLAEAQDRYRRLVRESHPDIAGEQGAEATIRLNLAMQAFEAHLAHPGDSHALLPEPTVDPVEVVDDALRVEAPPDELYARLAHALDIVGDLTYADASSGYLEAVVAMGNPSPSQLVVSLQGRGAHTEAFFTLEALGVEQPPDLADVVAAIAEVLATTPS